MRVVVDRNVFVAALLHGATPRRVYEGFLEGLFTPVFSPETLAELTDVLTRPSLEVLTSESEVATLFTLLQRDGVFVRPTQRTSVCRDAKDNILLECAAAGKVNCLITGDKDLLILRSFHGIPIVRPSHFLRHYLQ